MPTNVKRRKSIFKRYRLFPLILVGLIFLCVFTLLGLLIWSIIAYAGQLDVSQRTAVPAVIYLGGIFLTAVLMTALIKGGTVFPAAILSVAAAIATYFMADASQTSFANALLKAALSLLVGIASFTITKLYYILRRQPRVSRESRNLSDLGLAEPATKKNA